MEQSDRKPAGAVGGNPLPHPHGRGLPASVLARSPLRGRTAFVAYRLDRGVAVRGFGCVRDCLCLVGAPVLGTALVGQYHPQDRSSRGGYGSLFLGAAPDLYRHAALAPRHRRGEGYLARDRRLRLLAPGHLHEGSDGRDLAQPGIGRGRLYRLPSACTDADSVGSQMKPGQPSRTALAAAAHRAAHQVLEGSSIFFDPLAVSILGDEAATLGFDAGEHPSRRALRSFIAARSRFAEDALGDAYARGLRQLVILGAGLDTFAYRNPHAELRVFEVDHPATQAWKRQRLVEAGIEVPGSLTFAPVDFQRDTLAEKLNIAGLDPGQSAFFT